jgi:hypothetical protein
MRFIRMYFVGTSPGVRGQSCYAACLSDECRHVGTGARNTNAEMVLVVGVLAVARGPARQLCLPQRIVLVPLWDGGANAGVMGIDRVDPAGHP